MEEWCIVHLVSRIQYSAEANCCEQDDVLGQLATRTANLDRANGTFLPKQSCSASKPRGMHVVPWKCQRRQRVRALGRARSSVLCTAGVDLAQGPAVACGAVGARAAMDLAELSISDPPPASQASSKTGFQSTHSSFNHQSLVGTMHPRCILESSSRNPRPVKPSGVARTATHRHLVTAKVDLRHLQSSRPAEISEVRPHQLPDRHGSPWSSSVELLF